MWLKEKYNASSSYNEKVKILTLSPLNAKKTIEYFNSTAYLVAKSRRFRKEHGILPEIPHCSKGKSITNLISEEVINFYLNDDISRIMPGQSNVISVRQPNGEKCLKPKRLILGNLREIYNIYKEEGHTHIGFSTFAKLRPKQCIIAGSSGTHSVCVCTYHQNPALMIGSLGKKELNVSNMIKIAVCSVDSSNCMLGYCRDCSGKKGISDYLYSMDEVQTIDSVTYRKWTSTDRSTLECHSSSIDDFVEVLSDSIVKLTKHHYITKAQSKYLKSLKEDIPNDEVIILGDFSENYTFVVQDAAQGFHWVNDQATIHPFVLYYKDNGKLHHKSYCFISDYLTHNTTVVYCFQEILIKELKETMSFIKKIYYFSDGCIGQYKNRKHFCNITHHEIDFGIKAEWNYFATSHGKNACDGVGGIVKRAAYKASLQRTIADHILTAEQLFEFSDREIKGIKFFFVPTETISQTSSKLEERFALTQRITGTQSFHKIVPIKENLLKAYITSDSTVHTTCKVTDDPFSDEHVNAINMGNYVACCYEKNFWVGMITEHSEEYKDYKVSFLMQSKSLHNFIFPKNEDTCWIKQENILATLSSPNIVPGVKIVYSFSKQEISAARKKLNRSIKGNVI